MWGHNQVEAAYVRSDLFERRRVLMEQWAGYVAGCDVRRVWRDGDPSSRAASPDSGPVRVLWPWRQADPLEGLGWLRTLYWS